MSLIEAFKGWHYAKPKGFDISSFIAPPYDVIGEQQRASLLEQNDQNVVTLELPEGSAETTDPNNRYATSRKTWERFVSENTIVQDETPAIYMLEQSFVDIATGEPSSRISFIVQLELHEFSDGVVIPHELTLPKALGDRYDLLCATGVNYSQILGIYSDDSSDYQQIIDTVLATEPILVGTQPGDIKNRLWAIVDENLINKIVASLENKQVFIADGHHRYTVALSFKNALEKLSESGALDDDTAINVCAKSSKALKASRYVMAALSNMNDPKLRILAYNRAVKFPLDGEFNDQAFLEELSKTFEISESLSLDEIQQALDSSTEDEIVFAIARRNLCTESTVNTAPDENTASTVNTATDVSAANTISTATDASTTTNANAATRAPDLDQEVDIKLVRLTLDERIDTLITTNHSRTWKSLDVSVLHSLIVEPFFKIYANDPTTHDRIFYSANSNELLNRLINKEADVVFLMRPTRLDQLKEISLGGETMPQKSTFFYPKLPSGFVFRSIYDD